MDMTTLAEASDAGASLSLVHGRGLRVELRTFAVSDHDSALPIFLNLLTFRREFAPPIRGLIGTYCRALGCSWRLLDGISSVIPRRKSFSRAN